MRYYWIVIIIIIPLIVVTGIYHYSIFNFLSSTNPFPERLLLIILIVVTGIVGISSLFTYFLERKNIPVLEFNNFTRTKDNDTVFYYIRVKNKSGEGMAEKCEGWILIEEGRSQTIWANLSISCNIPFGLPMDLRLFGIKYEEINISPISKKVNSRQLLIPTLLPEHLRNSNPVVYDSRPLDDYIEKEITIQIGAIKGHTPKPLTIKISEIIEKAKVEKT